MDDNMLQNYPPGFEIVGGTIEVTSHLDRRNLISSLWRNFFTSSLVQDGDYLMGRSRALLQRHLNLMRLQDQNLIRQTYDMVRDMRDKMEDQSGTSQLRRNFEAREYRRRARNTFKLVESASARGLDNLLRNRLDEVTRPPPPPGDGSPPPPPGGGSGSPPPGDGSRGGFGTGTAASHLFGDSHVVSRITDRDVDEVDQVDRTAYQDEVTDEEDAIYDILIRDRTLKDVLAFTGDRTERGASALDQRLDEQGETCTLESFAMSEVVTWEDKRPHPVLRASVPPVDGDPYTCSTAPRRRL